GITAATAVTVGAATQVEQQLLQNLGLNVFPEALSLAPGGGRELRASITDHKGLDIDLTDASTGTRYFVVNPAIATVTASGVVTAVGQGSTTIAIIHGAAETLLSVKIEAPHVGPTVLGSAGGIVQGS